MAASTPHPQRSQLRRALRQQAYALAEALIGQGVPLAERPNSKQPDVLFWNDALSMPGVARLDWLWAHGLRPSRPPLAFESLKQALLRDRLDIAQWWVAHGAPLRYPGPFHLGKEERSYRAELIDALAEKGRPPALAWLAAQGAPLFSGGTSPSNPVWIALYQQPTEHIFSVVEALCRISPHLLFEPGREATRSPPHAVLVELAQRHPDRHPPEVLADLWMLLDRACQAIGHAVGPEHRQAMEATAVGPCLTAREHAQARANQLATRPALTSPRPRFRA